MYNPKEDVWMMRFAGTAFAGVGFWNAYIGSMGEAITGVAIGMFILGVTCVEAKYARLLQEHKE
ncbi:hypothetical protein [Bacillus phage SWEP1]|nr:hypothetical protein [Bacillus phage SWEP1]